MKIDLKSLRPVELADRPLFFEKNQLMGGQSCESNFANIFMYRQPYGMEFVECCGRLVVYERISRIIHYPIGESTDPVMLRDIASAFVAGGLIDGGVYDVPESFLDDYPDCDEYFDLEFDEGAIDYIFSVDKVATFTGPKLRKKHNLVKQFQTNWPYAKVEPVTPENIQIAAKLAANLNSRLAQCEFLDDEAVALKEGWEHFRELELEGIILFAEPKYPAGLSIYSRLPADTVDIHFEKADHSIKGASQTLTWQLALNLRGVAKFMNWEQDLNEDERRHAKRSLDPERFFKRYFLRLKQ